MLADLGLLACADTYVGNEMIRGGAPRPRLPPATARGACSCDRCLSRAGISGGEKKRLSIGIELVMKPKLIFLDEPTSGLDSFAAHSVVNKMRSIAEHGRCNVLCTIHQPSSEAFHAFHKAAPRRRRRLPTPRPRSRRDDPPARAPTRSRPPSAHARHRCCCCVTASPSSSARSRRSPPSYRASTGRAPPGTISPTTPYGSYRPSPTRCGDRTATAARVPAGCGCCPGPPRIASRRQWRWPRHTAC